MLFAVLVQCKAGKKLMSGAPPLTLGIFMKVDNNYFITLLILVLNFAF